MSDPTTRPGEMSRIKDMAGNDPYRERVLTVLAVLEERSEQSINWQRGTDEWRANHDKIDAVSFAEVRADIATLKGSVGKVSSSVATEQLSSRFTLKELVAGVLVLCAAIGALIAFIGHYLTSGPKP